MEKVSHTPGPWMLPHFADPEAKCQCGHVLSEFQHGMGAIATIEYSVEGQDWRDGDHEPLPVAIANAHLIAAAPDLLAALRAIMAKLDKGRDAPGHCHDRPGIWDDDNGEKAGQPCEWCVQWNAARAAIAKALPAAQGDGQ